VALSALVTVVAVFAIGAALWRASRKAKAPPPPPDAAARSKWGGELQKINVGATTGTPATSPETAILLLEEARVRYDWNQAGERNVESKATTLLTIVAGAAGALGIFGVTKEGKVASASPLALLAIAFAVGALVCLLYVLRAKGVARPDPSAFASGPVVSSDNRARVAVMLVGMYARDSYDNAMRFRYSRPMIFAAYVCVAAAAALTVINVATIAATAPSSVRAASPLPSANPKAKSAPKPTRHAAPATP
jgi:hypothetical protein